MLADNELLKSVIKLYQDACKYFICEVFPAKPSFSRDEYYIAILKYVYEKIKEKDTSFEFLKKYDQNNNTMKDDNKIHVDIDFETMEEVNKLLKYVEALDSSGTRIINHNSEISLSVTFIETSRDSMDTLANLYGLTPEPIKGIKARMNKEDPEYHQLYYLHFPGGKTVIGFADNVKGQKIDPVIVSGDICVGKQTAFVK
jgi:hypothetical protein